MENVAPGAWQRLTVWAGSTQNVRSWDGTAVTFTTGMSAKPKDWF
jgi:hypothetical protein